MVVTLSFPGTEILESSGLVLSHFGAETRNLAPEPL